MAAKNGYTGIDDYAVKVVRHTAHALVRRGRLQEADREDLEQELMLDLLRRLPGFDPARATFRTFVARIVRHRAARFVAVACSTKEGGRRNAVSLHDEIDDGAGETVERWATLDEETGRRRCGGSGDDDATRDLRFDLDEALSDLPREEREICAWLLQHSVTETARGTGMPRGTLWDAMQPIRTRFAAAGLDAYLRRRFPERVSK